MEITKATLQHLDAICRITDQAKAQLAGLGIDQWQRGYPNRDAWIDDIEQSVAYAAIENGQVLGAASILPGIEPSYCEIEGAWHSDTPYLSVHRVCVADGSKGKGIAGLLFAHSFRLAKEQGISSVRIDTHRGNIPMQHAIAKSGFSYCGVIHLVGGVDHGHERIAFDRLTDER